MIKIYYEMLEVEGGGRRWRDKMEGQGGGRRCRGEGANPVIMFFPAAAPGPHLYA